jgi:predicted transcriptional regulator
MTKKLVPPKVKDLLMTKFVMVSPNDSLDTVISTLLKHEIPAAPVVEKVNDTIDMLGCITEQDCVEYFANEIYYGNPDVTARSIMQRYTFCVTPQTDLFTAACLFTRQSCQLLPVVKKKHEFVGLVTRRRVLRALNEFEKKIYKHKAEGKTLRDFHEIVNMRFIIK